MPRIHPNDAQVERIRQARLLNVSRSALAVLLTYSASIGCVISGERAGERSFGDLAEARMKSPEFFTPGVVTQADIAAIPSYLICVTASRDLPDEQDAELLVSLELAAKSALLKYLSNGKPEGIELEISGMRILYSWKDDGSLLANFGVPMTGIKLLRKPVRMREVTTSSLPGRFGHEKAGGSTTPTSIVPSDDSATELKLEEEVSALVEHFRSGKLTQVADALEMLKANKASCMPEALRIYKRLKQDPGDGNALEELGNLYEKKRWLAQALSHYRMAWQIFNDISPKKAESVGYKVAVVTDSAKTAKESLDYYEEFLRRYPVSKHSPDVIKRIGQLRSKMYLQTEPPKQ